jgi:hypothetical protein
MPKTRRESLRGPEENGREANLLCTVHSDDERQGRGHRARVIDQRAVRLEGHGGHRRGEPERVEPKRLTPEKICLRAFHSRARLSVSSCNRAPHRRCEGPIGSPPIASCAFAGREALRAHIVSLPPKQERPTRRQAKRRGKLVVERLHSSLPRETAAGSSRFWSRNSHLDQHQGRCGWL